MITQNKCNKYYLHVYHTISFSFRWITFWLNMFEPINNNISILYIVAIKFYVPLLVSVPRQSKITNLFEMSLINWNFKLKARHKLLRLLKCLIKSNTINTAIQLAFIKIHPILNLYTCNANMNFHLCKPTLRACVA